MFDREDAQGERLGGLVPAFGAGLFGGSLEVRIPAGPRNLHHAFSENQLASKKWLLDQLFATLGGRYGTIYVLGGWYGVLGAMLLSDERFIAGQVLSIDIDPECAPVAERINERHVGTARFKAITADVRELSYGRFDGQSVVRRAWRAARQRPNLVINTSCEHMAPAEDWYGRLPSGMPLVVQSNDNYDCPEHVNCVADLDEFRRQVPMTEICYEGALQRRRYSRFMLIGRK